MSEPLVFQQFENIADAEKVAAILEEAGISTMVEKPAAILDSNFIGTNYVPSYNLMIDGADFENAREVLLEKAEVNLDEIDKDYLLLTFSDEELMDVIAKPDEWGVYNYNIATALLKKKGVTVSREQKDAFAKDRLAELSKQKSFGMFWIIVAYTIPLLNLVYVIANYETYIGNNLTWLFPGIGGLIIGFILVYSKKTLPNGTSLPIYIEKHRKHGPIILKVNAIVWIANGAIFTIYHTFLKM